MTACSTLAILAGPALVAWALIGAAGLGMARAAGRPRPEARP